MSPHPTCRASEPLRLILRSGDLIIINATIAACHLIYWKIWQCMTLENAADYKVCRKIEIAHPLLELMQTTVGK